MKHITEESLTASAKKWAELDDDFGHDGVTGGFKHSSKGNNMSDKTLKLEDILTWRDGEFWIAAWTRHDMVMQAASESAAIESLLGSIGMRAVLDCQNDTIPFSKIPVAPEAEVARWRVLHAEAHKPQSK